MDYIRAEGDFHKRYKQLKETNKAEIRPEEQSEKAESCRDNLWKEIQLKGQQRQQQEDFPLRLCTIIDSVTAQEST